MPRVIGGKHASEMCGWMGGCMYGTSVYMYTPGCEDVIALDEPPPPTPREPSLCGERRGERERER